MNVRSSMRDADHDKESSCAPSLGTGPPRHPLHGHECAKAHLDLYDRVGDGNFEVPTLTPPRNQLSPLARLVRYPMLGLGYGLGQPLVKLMERSDQMGCLLQALGRRLTRTNTWPARYRGYRPTAHDVFVSTYGRSGTNWTLQMAYQVATRARGEFAHIHDVVAWPDLPAPLRKDFAVDLYDQAAQKASPTGLRIIKTHLHWHQVPYSPEARYIFVVRDPKDVFVSTYHFMRDLLFGPSMCSVSTWLDFFLSPDFLMGYWPTHVHGYWAQRHRENILFLTFKDMKASLERSVTRVANFLDVPLQAREFERVVEKSSFSYMKSIDGKFHPGAVMPWTSRQAGMMRLGGQGGSGEMLSLRQQRRIDATFQQELARLGSAFNYETICSLAPKAEGD